MKHLKYIIISAILLLFAFLFDSCELIKGNDDKLQEVWKLLPDSRINIKTEKKRIVYYLHYDDPENDPYNECPYKFRNGQIIIDNIPWLRSGAYDVYISGSFMYWYFTDSDGQYYAYHIFQR